MFYEKYRETLEISGFIKPYEVLLPGRIPVCVLFPFQRLLLAFVISTFFNNGIVQLNDF